MKKNILIFAIGFICATVIGVGASMLMKAEEVSYTPNNNDWKVNNVQEAINDIYTNKINSVGKVIFFETVPNHAETLNNYTAKFNMETSGKVLIFIDYYVYDVTRGTTGKCLLDGTEQLFNVANKSYTGYFEKELEAGEHTLTFNHTSGYNQGFRHTIYVIQ